MHQPGKSYIELPRELMLMRRGIIKFKIRVLPLLCWDLQAMIFETARRRKDAVDYASCFARPQLGENIREII